MSHVYGSTSTIIGSGSGALLDCVFRCERLWEDNAPEVPPRFREDDAPEEPPRFRFGGMMKSAR